MYAPDAAALGALGFRDDPYWHDRRPRKGFLHAQQRARRHASFAVGFVDDPYWNRGVAGLGVTVYPEFLDAFNANTSRYSTLSAKAAALGPQRLEAWRKVAEIPMGTGRHPESGLESSFESTRFDIRFYPGKMDKPNVDAQRLRLDLLENTLAAMTESPPAETQDAENDRAMEYMQTEVNKALEEKKAALANAGKFLGVPIWAWLAGAGTVAVGGIAWAVWPK
jgi:hypothetical protein